MGGCNMGALGQGGGEPSWGSPGSASAMPTEDTALETCPSHPSQHPVHPSPGAEAASAPSTSVTPCKWCQRFCSLQPSIAPFHLPMEPATRLR